LSLAGERGGGVGQKGVAEGAPACAGEGEDTDEEGGVSLVVVDGPEGGGLGVRWVFVAAVDRADVA